MIVARIEPPGWLRDGIVVQLSAGPRLDFTGPSGCLAPGSAFPLASRGSHDRAACKGQWLPRRDSVPSLMHTDLIDSLLSHTGESRESRGKAGKVGGKPGKSVSVHHSCPKRRTDIAPRSSGKVRWTICNLIPFARRRLSGHESGSSVLPTAERHEEP